MSPPGGVSDRTDTERGNRNMATDTHDTTRTTATAGAGGAAAKPAPATSAAPGRVQSVPPGRGGKPLPDDVRRVLRLRVPLIVRLAHHSMPLGEILRLSPGTLIEFEKSGDSDLELMITNRVIGHGHAVKVGENFGLRIQSIGPVRERIESLRNA